MCFITQAQNKLTLQQAIQMGIANNIDVNQSDPVKPKSKHKSETIKSRYASQS